MAWGIGGRLHGADAGERIRHADGVKPGVKEMELPGGMSGDGG